MRRKRKKNYEKLNIWRSYSDIMAGLLLLFILVMCISFMQAQKSYRDKLAEEEDHKARQAALLTEMASLVQQNSDQQSALDSQDLLLAQQAEDLAAQALKLAEQESEIDLQTAEALATQAILDAQAQQLAQQESELASQRATLTSQQTTLDQQTAMMEAQQAKIEQIIGVKADLISALKTEFDKVSMAVSIDQDGAIALDSNVLFGVDASELTAEGSEVLKTVLPIYCHVLLSPEYISYIAELSVNGYTDTSGDYRYNMQLSEARAMAVADNLLDLAGTMLSPEELESLKSKLTVSGHSMSNPILNSDGSVNMDASRRVVVRFRLRDEEMINELRDAMSGTPSGAAVPETTAP